MSTTGRERVPPLPPEERDERQAALVTEAGAELSVYTTLVRNTDVFADLLPLGQRLLQQSTLDSRVRELVILRVAWRCRAPYVFAHHDVIGRAAGLTDADLAAVVSETDDPLLRAADELVADHRLSDPTWHGLAGRHPTEQIIEICVLAGFYAMLAGTLNTLGVQLEEGYPPPTWAS
jgi:4-carboxymuconolactone decarboxylase